MTLARFAGASALVLFVSAGTATAGGAVKFATVEELGKALFFDVNLSKNRSQACATCHDPEHGFTDPRETAAGRAVSLGDDGVSLGDRNAPSAAYASFSPTFHRTDKGLYRGGQFHDGREADLAGQAGGPPLNALEMGMPDKAMVVARLRDSPDYVEAFQRLFGQDAFSSPEKAYTLMSESVAAFEKTDVFAPFDSKYDRFLRGEAKLSDQEELGRVLFFSQQFTNCNLCHQLRPSAMAEQETFSNYEFHNIGVPVNAEARRHNGVDADHIDNGLQQNAAVAGDPAAAGRFKVPGLRNVAVTGPYMHNGVFKDLRTVVLFYNKYNSRAKARQVNPETGEVWAAPEVNANLSLKELETGPALKDREVDALVAFMKTLTDKRYEHLLGDR